MTTVFITQQAISSGIVQIEAEDVSGNVIRIAGERLGSTWYCHGKDKNWHLTLDAAKKRAEKMKLDKIASLKKQLARIEALTF